MSKEVLQSIIKTPEEKAQTKEAIAANKERAHTRRREAIIGEYIKTPKDKLLMAVAKFVGIPVDNLFEKLTDANEKDIQLRWDKRRAEREATHGALTGLTNLNGLEKHLKKLQDSLQFNEPEKRGMHDEKENNEDQPKYFSVVNIDIDGLKRVNDEFGHPAGDRLLQLVADIMRDKVRVHDLPARVGGDEFVVVVEENDPHSCYGAILLAERIRGAIQDLRLSAVTGNEKDTGPVATASIGISPYFKDSKKMLRIADDAENISKGLGDKVKERYEDIKIIGTLPKDDSAKNQTWIYDLSTNAFKKVA